MGYKICQSGKWVTGTCPKYNVCDKNVCRPLCDGELAASAQPRICAG
jgi:hypothetical protein